MRKSTYRGGDIEEAEIERQRAQKTLGHGLRENKDQKNLRTAVRGERFQ